MMSRLSYVDTMDVSSSDKRESSNRLPRKAVSEPCSDVQRGGVRYRHGKAANQPVQLRSQLGGNIAGELLAARTTSSWAPTLPLETIGCC
jgi:hypothetical protein